MQCLVDERHDHPQKVFNKTEKLLLKRAVEIDMKPSASVQKSTCFRIIPTTFQHTNGLTEGAAPTKAAKGATKAAPKGKSKPAAKGPSTTTTKAAKGKAKATTTTTTTTKTTATKRGRKKEEEESDDEEEKPPAKKPRGAPKAAAKPKRKVVINEAPKEKLDVYVFGEGSSGELGLGTEGPPAITDVKRPRLNPLLSAEDVGVVQLAAGGMHAVALTHDNQILTWGVNDQGTLGRVTAGETDDSGLNPLEANPAAASMENVPNGTVFTQVAAGDSVTMALTDEGHVYGCGTFRVCRHLFPITLRSADNSTQGNEGILGFSSSSKIQTTLIRVPGLTKITSIVCGDNHVLALDEKGNVSAWGSGQQNQLGRRVVERTRMNGLVPRQFGLPKNKVTYINCGAYHSFAIDKSGKVWSWGLNNYGETGHDDNAGEDDAVILKPAVVDSLTDKEVIALTGGAHHSIAVTADGRCLVWGRLDGYQSGLDIKTLPEEDVIRDEANNPRILMNPTEVPGMGKTIHAAAGTDTSVIVTEEGKAWSWGFSANYQTGQGTDEDVEQATWIDNTAVRGKKLIWSGCGGQFSMLASVAAE